jgi:hypothetical protein
MKKLCFIFSLSCILSASAQDITISKDSIKVYNSFYSSFADVVTFTSHASGAIHLDSALVLNAEIDTVGLSSAIVYFGIEVAWRTSSPASQMFTWTLDSAGPNTWRLTKKAFSPTNAEPLSFSGNGSTSQMFSLECGIFLFGETMPRYTKYINGTMRLFFSNGQIIDLKLWSQDLRTAVRKRELVASKEKPAPHNNNFRYLVNGQRISAIDMPHSSKTRISCIKLYEKK